MTKPPQPGQTVLYRMWTGATAQFVVEKADEHYLLLRSAQYPSSTMTVRWRYASGKRNPNVTLRKERKKGGDAAGRLGLRKVD